MSIDPRTPATTLSVEEGAPITGFVAAAPNANYTLNEREKGVPVVSTSSFTPALELADAIQRHCADISLPQVDLCRVEGRQRTCTEVHQVSS